MYEIRIKASAQKDLLRLPYRIRLQINEKIMKLALNPRRRDLDIKKMKGNDLCRLRIGDYRVIYQAQEHFLIILIVAIGHRKEIYQ